MLEVSSICNDDNNSISKISLKFRSNIIEKESIHETVSNGIGEELLLLKAYSNQINLVNDMLTGLYPLLWGINRVILSESSIIGTIISAEETEVTFCGTIIPLLSLKRLCQGILSISNVILVLQIFQCLCPNIVEIFHPVQNPQHSSPNSLKLALVPSPSEIKQSSDQIWTFLILSEILGLTAVTIECTNRLYLLSTEKDQNGPTNINKFRLPSNIASLLIPEQILSIENNFFRHFSKFSIEKSPKTILFTKTNETPDSQPEEIIGRNLINHISSEFTMMDDEEPCRKSFEIKINSDTKNKILVDKKQETMSNSIAHPDAFFGGENFDSKIGPARDDFSINYSTIFSSPNKHNFRYQPSTFIPDNINTIGNVNNLPNSKIITPKKSENGFEIDNRKSDLTNKNISLNVHTNSPAKVNSRFSFNRNSFSSPTLTERTLIASRLKSLHNNATMIRIKNSLDSINKRKVVQYSKINFQSENNSNFFELSYDLNKKKETKDLENKPTIIRSHVTPLRRNSTLNIRPLDLEKPKEIKNLQSTPDAKKNPFDFKILNKLPINEVNPKRNVIADKSSHESNMMTDVKTKQNTGIYRIETLESIGMGYSPNKASSSTKDIEPCLINIDSNTLVSIKVIRAWSLSDTIGGSNPYVLIDWSSYGKCTTQSIKNSISPHFGSILKFRSPFFVQAIPNSRKIRIKGITYYFASISLAKVYVYSRNKSVSDELLGFAEFKVEDCIQNEEPIILYLSDFQGKGNCGFVEVSCFLS